MKNYSFLNNQEPRLMNVFVSLFVLSFSIIALNYHYHIITFPYPLEFREGPAIQTTNLIIEGKNPFAIQQQPHNTNTYGILYSLVTYPFMVITNSGNGLLAHRAIAGLFILLSCLVVYLFIRKSEHVLGFARITVLLLYLSLLNLVTPLTRPDSLGLFLLLLGLYIPEKFNYSYGALVGSIVLGVLAFLSKSFFLLIFPYLAIYLFLFQSKKKAVLFFILSLAIFIPSILLVQSFFETYVGNSFFNYLNNTNYSLRHLAGQIKYYVLSYWGVFLILGIAIILKIPKKRRDAQTIKFSLKLFLQKSFNFKNLSHPLLSRYIISAGKFYLLLSVFIIIFKLGGHTGATRTYFYQLLSPFLFIAVTTFINKNDKKTPLYMFLALCNIATYYFLVLPHYTVEEVASAWQDIELVVEENDDILNSPVITPVLQKYGKRVNDSGQSEYFIWSTTPSFFKNIPEFEESDRLITQRIQDLGQEMKFAIEEKQFDIVVLPNFVTQYVTEAVLFENYYLDRTLFAPMPHTEQLKELQILKPKR